MQQKKSDSGTGGSAVALFKLLGDTSVFCRLTAASDILLMCGGWAILTGKPPANPPVNSPNLLFTGKPSR